MWCPQERGAMGATHASGSALEPTSTHAEGVGLGPLTTKLTGTVAVPAICVGDNAVGITMLIRPVATPLPFPPPTQHPAGVATAPHTIPAPHTTNPATTRSRPIVVLDWHFAANRSGFTFDFGLESLFGGIYPDRGIFRGIVTNISGLLFRGRYCIPGDEMSTHRTHTL